MDGSRLSWSRFEAKHADAEVAFEDLSLLLFLGNHRFNNPEVKSLSNQAGIEMEPIQNVRTGKWVSYQAKYSRNGAPYGEIERSIKTACEKKADGTYQNLDVIDVFIKNEVRLPNNSSKRIEALAKDNNVKIVWRVGKYFQAQLLNSKNYSLHVMFFGNGDYQGFYLSSKNQLLEDYKNNKKPINIAFEEGSKAISAQDVVDKIASRSTKYSLIVGGAGSGKTSFLYGLRESLLQKGQPLKQQWPIDYLPVFLQLKYLEHQDLSIYLQQKRQEFNLAADFPYVYLFDGVDEISHSRLRRLISEIDDLLPSPQTFGIVVTGRKSSLNTLSLISGRPSDALTLFEISQLNETDIEKYFTIQGNEIKSELWSKLKKASFVSEIKDIFQLEIFFKNIEKFNENSSVADLYDTYTHELLNNHERDNLDKLDILNTKPEAIIKLNKRLSKTMHIKEASALELKELQQIIEDEIKPSSNIQTNEVVDYQEKTFFTKDNSPATPPGGLMVYRHKRLQDYFLIEQTIDEIEQDWSVLRKYRLLSNPDLFNNLLLPKLEKKFQSDTFFAQALALSLLKTYVRYDEDGFGVYFDELPKVLANLSNLTFDYLLESSGFMFEPRLKYTPEVAYLFATHGKQAYSEKIIQKLNSLSKKEHHEVINQAPLYYFSLLLYRGRPIKELLGYFNRDNNLRKWSDRRLSTGKMSAFEGLFMAACKNGSTTFSEFIGELSSEEIASLSSLFTDPEVLPYMNSLKVKEKLSEILEAKQLFEKYENLSEYLFIKMYYEGQLSTEELSQAEDIMNELTRKNSRPVDWYGDEELNRYASLYWVTHSDLGWLTSPKEPNSFSFYEEHKVYAQLYSFYLGQLRGRRLNIRLLLRFFVDNVEQLQQFYRQYLLKRQISKLWVILISRIREDALAKDVFDVLMTKTKLISQYLLTIELAKLSPKRFKLFTNVGTVAALRETLLDGSDKSFQEEVNSELDIALMYTYHDETTAVEIIKQVLDKSLIRHGWHKDIVASLLFVDVFLIACDDKLFSPKEIRDYSFEILSLLQEVIDITDGDHTHHGPANLIDGVIRFDLELAKELILKVQKDDRGYVPNHVITHYIKRLVDNFYDYEDIIKQLNLYRSGTDYQGKTYPDYFFEKLDALTYIYEQSGLSTEIKASVAELIIQVNEVYSDRASSIAPDSDKMKSYVSAWEKAKRILNENNKELLIANPSTLSTDSSSSFVGRDRIKEKELKQLIRQVDSLESLKKLFEKDAKDVDWRAQLDERTADLLVRKTLKYSGSAKLATDYLNQQMYVGDLVPYEDTTSESYYLEQIMVALTKNPAMRADALQFLKQAGLFGFYKAYRVFSLLGERDVCKSLFAEYWRFLQFLVYR